MIIRDGTNTKRPYSCSPRQVVKRSVPCCPTQSAQSNAIASTNLIGFNKCGTRSIDRFFRLHGLKTMKWARKNLAKSLKADLTAGIKPLENWPDVNVFSDMESVSVHDMIEG